MDDSKAEEVTDRISEICSGIRAAGVDVFVMRALPVRYPWRLK
jgi:hypothetical protein